MLFRSGCLSACSDALNSGIQNLCDIGLIGEHLSDLLQCSRRIDFLSILRNRCADFLILRICACGDIEFRDGLRICRECDDIESAEYECIRIDFGADDISCASDGDAEFNTSFGECLDRLTDRSVNDVEICIDLSIIFDPHICHDDSGILEVHAVWIFRMSEETDEPLMRDSFLVVLRLQNILHDLTGDVQTILICDVSVKCLSRDLSDDCAGCIFRDLRSLDIYLHEKHLTLSKVFLSDEPDHRPQESSADLK